MDAEYKYINEKIRKYAPVSAECNGLINSETSGFISMKDEYVRDFRLSMKLTSDSLCDRETVDFDHENATLFATIELLFDELIGEKAYSFVVNNNLTLRSVSLPGLRLWKVNCNNPSYLCSI